MIRFTTSIRERSLLALTLIIFVLCAAGASRLSLNSDTRVFFAEGNANRQALDTLEARYAPGASLLIALKARDGDVFTSERIAVINEITDAAWRMPYATRVDSITNAVHITSNGNGVIITPMGDVDDDDTTPASPDMLRSRALSDGLLVNKLVAPDGRMTGVLVRLDYPASQSAAVREIMAAAKNIVADSGADQAGLDAHFGGRAAMSHAFSAAAIGDLTSLTLLAYAVIGVLAGLLLGSPRAALALMVTVLGAVIAAFGLFGWFGGELNAASTSAPTIIIGIGVAALFHLVTAVARARENGANRFDAPAIGRKSEWKPIALALSTTAVGFASLNFADSPPFQSLGNLTAAGALFCLLFGMVWTPALLKGCRRLSSPAAPFIDQSLVGIAGFIVRRRRAILVVAPVAIIAIAIGVSRTVIDDDYVAYFSEQYDFRRDADIIDRELTGTDIVEFDIAASGPDMITDPNFLNMLDEFETWLRAHPKVVHVSSIAEPLRRLNQHMTTGAPDAHHLPTEQGMAAQYLLAYEMSLPFGLTLTDQVAIDKSRTAVRATVARGTTQDIRKIRVDGETWLRQHNNGAASPSVGAGLSVMFAYLSHVNIKAMTTGTIVALMVITGILAIAFRSMRFALISLIPNVLPAFIAFGVWGFLVGKVGVAVSAVAAATLGVIVDDTVHMLWRYREARRRDYTAEQAIRDAFRRVGPPMLMSSLILVAAFLVLSTSGFHITNALGGLSAITIIAALITDFFVLGAVLLTIDGAPRERTNPSVSLASTHTGEYPVTVTTRKAVEANA